MTYNVFGGTLNLALSIYEHLYAVKGRCCFSSVRGGGMRVCVCAHARLSVQKL